MNTQTVLKFMQETGKDVNLRQQLKVLLGVGDGDISNEIELDEQEAAALKGKRGELVQRFAKQHGYNFSMEDLKSVVATFEKYKAGTISKEEFSKIVGSTEVGIESLEKTVSLVYRGIPYIMNKSQSNQQVIEQSTEKEILKKLDEVNQKLNKIMQHLKID